MAWYQTSKEITKFAISGGLAVLADAIVYFAVSQYLDVNVSKGISFCSGMLVTYNMNKYWTWRKTDKNSRRLMLFVLLYAGAMAVNIASNSLALSSLPDNLINLRMLGEMGDPQDLITIQFDKVLAFVIATGISATLTFFGQKFWLFKDSD